MKNPFAMCWNHRAELRSMLSSLYFNFHYLPFRQAVHLPVLLYKPKLPALRGRVVVTGPVRYGMIRLGFSEVSVYPNSGIIFENHGGTVCFRGRCIIGNNSAVSVGDKGELTLGEHVEASTSCKIICYDHIDIGERTRLGWDCLVMDTDFHSLKYADGHKSRGHYPIVIGPDCWIGNGCHIMKRSVVAPRNVVAAGTCLQGPVTDKPDCLIASQATPYVKREGVHWDYYDDAIHYD